jgi:hypothetical protein
MKQVLPFTGVPLLAIAMCKLSVVNMICEGSSKLSQNRFKFSLAFCKVRD